MVLVLKLAPAPLHTMIFKAESVPLLPLFAPRFLLVFFTHSAYTKKNFMRKESG